MRIFLLWLPKTPDTPLPTTDRVADNLGDLFGDLFAPAPEVRQRNVGPARLVWMDLPVAGFDVPFWEEQGEAFAAAFEYPLNARRVLRSRDAMPAAGESVLLSLDAELQKRPAECLAELIPPFGLIAGSDGELRLHNDGLGMAQVFEHENEHGFFVTNRLMALRAAGIDLRPKSEDWGVRFVTGWFPRLCTGFEGVSYLKPGTMLRLSERGVERTVTDIVGKWVNPGAMSVDESLELGRQSMLDMLTDAMELWRRPSVGLSGGWDSRAVVACLRHLGADMDLRVRGSETNFDVMISAELARMAGLELRIKTGGGIPSESVEGCRHSIEKALLWQAGSFVTLKHKNFLAKAGKDRLDGGVVNVMGQHGGIGKADFAAKIRAHEREPDKFESKLLDKLLRDSPVYLRKSQADHARSEMQAAYRRAGDYGLTGRGPLHFLFLEEYTRRWGSATINAQTGLVVAPFLNPGMIRACYAYPEADLPSKPMHRFITQTLAPDWAEFPYEDQATEEDLTSGRIPPVTIAKKGPAAEELPEWRRVKRRHHKFGYRYYWKAVGYPLVEDAFAQGGFWTEIFDPDLAREHWLDAKTGGDLISIAHLLPGVTGHA